MNEMDKKVNETNEEIVVKESVFTKIGRNVDERRKAKAEKKAAMTPEEKKKKNLKLGAAVAGVLAVGTSIVLAVVHGQSADVPELTEGLDEVPFDPDVPEVDVDIPIG